MGAFGSVIGHGYDQIMSCLLLYIKVPLLHVADARIPVNGIVVKHRDLRIGWKSIGQGQNLIRPRDKIVADGKRWLAGQLGIELVVNGRIVKNPIAAANHSVLESERLPGYAKSGGEVVSVRIHQGARKLSAIRPLLPGQNQAGSCEIGSDIQIGDVIPNFGIRGLVLIPNSQCDR